MTVSYTGDVANGSSFGCFWKILGRWKGSVYKLIWRELIAYLLIYFAFNLLYRYGLDSQQRHTFEKVKVYTSKQIESIPMSFVLGFYVTLIVKRWWEQYWLLPLPDNLALYISSSLHGQDERGRILRRTIMRYLILSYIIMLQRISFRVKKRFPTLQHLVDAGLMMESEKKIFDKFEEKTTVSKFWMPTVWASNLVNRARLEGRIQSDHMLQTIITELSDFRRRLGRVMIYDTVSVPLVYTQVVTLAVYTYFIAALLGRQWVHPDEEHRLNDIYPGYQLDLGFPIFLSLQFIFYVGWLKVAETLINPFGEDDDDFELNWLIDRHIQVSYMVVDEMHEEHPELLRDQYWEQVVPAELPYNVAAGQFRRKEPQGSTASMKIKSRETIYDNMPQLKRNSSVIPDEVYADLEGVADSPLADGRKNWIQRLSSFRSNSSSSSIFNRTRAQQLPLGNGGLPNVVKNTGHRMSLYEKLLSRRSSREKNSPLAPPIRATANGGTTITKDTLMPYPDSRPRVPTPDVARETQINNNITNPPGTEHVNGNLVKNITKGQVAHLSVTPNHYSVSTNGVIGNGGKTLQNMNQTTAKTLQNVNPATAKTVQNVNQSIPPTTVTNNPRPKSPSLNIEVSGMDPNTHVMLSPIEENDGSPYSTSSTNRSSKSSNYPTTSAIFGRKPSPPPPKDELPPIPIIVSKPSSTRSGDLNTKDALRALDSVIESEVKERNDGFETHDEDPYQTISEAGEAKAEYAKNTMQYAREYHNGRRLSKEKQELMIKKLKGLSAVNKSIQATLPDNSVQNSTPDDKHETSSSRNSVSEKINVSIPQNQENGRTDSHNKCTSTEADVSNNNTSINLRNDLGKETTPPVNDPTSTPAAVKSEVFV